MRMVQTIMPKPLLICYNLEHLKQYRTNLARRVAVATQEEVIKPRGSTVGQIDPADWERARRSQDEMRRDPEGAKGRNKMEMEHRNDQTAKEEKVGDVGQPDAYLSSLFDTWSPSVLGTR